MKKIALIGAGQLGSRYLQGLAKSDLEISIEVVEPFESSRDIAKQRFEEIPANGKIKKINFYEKILDLSNGLDLVIVATSSDVRHKVVKELLENKKVKNLILEKVLFQKIEEYFEVENLLIDHNVKCWVNHSSRTYPFYKKLKEDIGKSEQVNFTVSGGGWGLACNSLHFLDLFSYLTNAKELVINSYFLDKRVVQSKRNGFIEFIGKLSGKLDNHMYDIVCIEKYSPLVITIASDAMHAVVDEAKGWYRIAKKSNNWEWEENSDKIVYFQSEITHELCREIIEQETCGLPTYKLAMNMHVKFIDSLLEHYNSFAQTKLDYLPIT